jgi:DNA-binding transcriptional MerR regulator
MERPADAFRTISEVADDLDLPQHVLRFWETRFTQIKPLKRGGGRRYYRPDDVELLRAIRHLLYGEGYTIRGVQRILKEQGVKAVIGLVRASSAAGAAARDGEPPATLPAGAPPREEPLLQAQPRAASAGDTLTAANIHVLQAALAEISECARILHAARG